MAPLHTVGLRLALFLAITCRAAMPAAAQDHPSLSQWLLPLIEAHRGRVAVAVELVSRDASEAILAHLKACDDKLKFPRFLPDDAVLAFKTGSLDDVRTAAGILYTRGGPVALCVLTAENEDRRWTRGNAGDLLCAAMAREVFAAFDRH